MKKLKKVAKPDTKRGPSLNALCASAAFSCTGTSRITDDGKRMLRDKKVATAQDIATACKDVALRLSARAVRLAKEHPAWDLDTCISAAILGEGDPPC